MWVDIQKVPSAEGIWQRDAPLPHHIMVSSKKTIGGYHLTLIQGLREIDKLSISRNE
ncbi:hypothetical protein ACQ3JU_0810 (plasmid) [Bradyrhizobium guangxiense]